MTDRIAELRAKIRALRFADNEAAFRLTDAECDALLRQLVLDAERAALETVQQAVILRQEQDLPDDSETFEEEMFMDAALDGLANAEFGKSCLLDNPGDLDKLHELLSDGRLHRVTQRNAGPGMTDGVLRVDSITTSVVPANPRTDDGPRNEVTVTDNFSDRLKTLIDEEFGLQPICEPDTIDELFKLHSRLLLARRRQEAKELRIVEVAKRWACGVDEAMRYASTIVTGGTIPLSDAGQELYAAVKASEEPKP